MAAVRILFYVREMIAHHNFFKDIGRVLITVGMNYTPVFGQISLKLSDSI